MVILRPTRKLRSLLPATGPPSASSDTALGDWYVNRIVVGHQPLLLLVSSTSLLPMLAPARDVRGLPGRLAGLVADRLKRYGIEARTVDAEIEAMTPLTICPTTDRAVLGIMVDFARSVSHYLDPGRWGEDALRLAERRLAETPFYASRSVEHVVFPNRTAPRLLRAKWRSDEPHPDVSLDRSECD